MAIFHYADSFSRAVQARAGYYLEPHSQRAQKEAPADCIAGADAVKAR